MTSADFAALLKRRMGLDADSIGVAAVGRAVRQRAMACTGGDETAYWRLVSGSAQEQQELIETVVVPETSFFRHAGSMQTLGLLARQRSAQVGELRILSLPCSSGEEPYTIVMALLDAGLDAARISVLGMDISDRLVHRARDGVYGRNAFRGEDLAFRTRYFSETPAGYSVTPRVRAHTRFQTGNLLDPALSLQSGEYDFVFCRNLLIYFDHPTQEAAVAVLRRLCKADGYIFVGPAEASLLTRLGMVQISAPGAFAFHNAIRQPGPVQAAVAPQRWPLAARQAREQVARPPGRPAGGGRNRLQPFAAPLPVAAPSRTPGSTMRGRASPAGNPTGAAQSQAGPPSLAEIQAMADAGRLQQARQAATAHIQAHGVSADAYYLTGLIDDASGARQAAEMAYRKALYLEPAHRQAMLHLASLLETRGDAAGARQLRNRASRHEDNHA